MKIPVVEIFPTIQGEGPGLGKPSLFIRLGGCNLRCQFRGEACDTPYAVFTPAQLDEKNPKLKFGYDQWYLTELPKLVHIIEVQKIEHLVFSGGEPMMYQKSIFDVMMCLDRTKFTAEIETNGSIAPIIGLIECKEIQFNVSVKLSSSNQEAGYDDKRINPTALKEFPADRSTYKFVITDPEKDLLEIKGILDIAKLPVYVMPEGMTREDQIRNAPAVVKLAIDNGFRFSPREHILIWDTKKGV